MLILWSHRTLATSTYTPAIPYVQIQFGVSRELAIIPLSLYTLGMGIGPLFAAPLSELFGRRIIYLLSMPLFLVFTSGAGAAKSIQTLIVCRCLAGTLGTAPLAIGAGTISDIWDLERDGGIAGLGILVGFIFVVITFAVLDKTVYQRVMRASVGRVAPEHRLYASMIGSIMLPISLFWPV